MSPLAWAAISSVMVTVMASVVVTVALRHRRGRARRPLSAAEKLDTARKASRALRRESRTRRPDRGHFEDGDPARDRYGAALLENSTYGYGADGGSGGGGD